VFTEVAGAGQPSLVLAPIRGVTTAAFRRGFADCFGGFDRALAPYVVPDSRGSTTGSHFRDALPDANDAMPTVPQILTTSPGDFVRAATFYLASGCSEVNWNLGCPYPMVTRRGRGAGMLPHPDRIDAFLRHVCNALGTRVSVKLRLGLGDSDEVEPVFEVLDRYPLTEVILHPRTARQRYGGAVDLAAFARCSRASRHPIVYNGDIVSVASFQDKRSAFPSVHRWMIGRGAVMNPSLPGAIRAGRDEAPDLRRLARFHDKMLEHYRSTLSGPAHVLHKMQGLWTYWARGFDPKSKPIKKILRAKRLGPYEGHAREVFDGAVRWVGADAGSRFG